MYKKIIIPIAAFIGLLSMAFYQIKQEDKAISTEENIGSHTYGPIVVLELFTSQGCSSCPPADVLLDKAKSDHPERVFTLSYHVDYWNYIGWEDPFSKSAYSVKQRAYNKKFGSRSNYTPQLVVNGLEHFVGSNGAKLKEKIKFYGIKNVANSISISKIKKTGSTVDFNYDVQGELAGKILRAVLVIDEKTTSVKRGENRNRVLKNSNIVVAEIYLPLNLMGTGSIEIPRLVTDNEKTTLILIVEDDTATITGASKARV